LLGKTSAVTIWVDRRQGSRRPTPLWRQVGFDRRYPTPKEGEAVGHGSSCGQGARAA
jgi:hypothetical protein